MTNLFSLMNQYQKIKDLGSGAFGTVILAKKGNDYYAIKRTNIANATRQECQDAFNEINNLKSINNHHVVKVFHSFTENGNLYMVMEYINDGDLAKKIDQRSNVGFSEDEILYIFIQIVLAIKCVHEQNIIHRDIKPQNIFITRDNYVKIGDFNVSYKLANRREITRELAGTNCYLSPEMLSGQGCNTQTDIFSLGCVLFELCTLTKAFKYNNPQDYINAMNRRHYHRIPDRYSQNLKNLINRMLDPNPQTRITANQILQLDFIRSRLEIPQRNDQLNETIRHTTNPPPPPPPTTSEENNVFANAFSALGAITFIFWLSRRILGRR